MSDIHKAKVGDTIRVIGGICGGEEYLVIECEKDNKYYGDSTLLWTRQLGNPKGVIGYFGPDTKYEITSSQPTQCVRQYQYVPERARLDEIDVNEFLRRQIDKNLRSVFE